MDTHTSKRNPYIDIIKAIGIISIVLGHGGGEIPFIKLPLSTFVYLYHIMIFFFVAGFCFKKENADKPYLYIGKRLGSVMPLFMGYSVFFVVIHNHLLSYSFLNESQYLYDFNTIIVNCLNSLIFEHFEMMLGAFWFIPVYIVATGLFCVLFSGALKNKFTWLFHTIFIILTALLGIYIHIQNMYLAWHIQTAILAIPIIYAGYFSKKYWVNLERFIPKWGFLLAGGILCWIITLDIGSVELARNQIFAPWLFYPVTLVGIYFCLSLGKLLNHWKLSRNIFAYIGRNSYHIMALHFFAFKIVDSVYGTLMHEPSSVIREFPHAFHFLWPVHNLAGIVLPLAFTAIMNCGLKFVKCISARNVKHS